MCAFLIAVRDVHWLDCSVPETRVSDFLRTYLPLA